MIRYLLMLWMAFFALSSVLRADDLADDNAAVSDYLDIAEHDARLAQIGYRLSTANADYCPRTSPKMGWVLHDIAQYPNDENVTKAFRFQTPISVLKLVKGGPADIAGVKEDDGYIGLSSDNSALKTQSYGYTGEPIISVARFNDYRRLSGVIEDINATLSGFKDTKDHNIIVERDGEILKLPFTLNSACTTDYTLDARSKIDAGANGTYVRITLGLSEFLSDDDEYAAAIAHELAHNILEHRKLIADGKAGKGPLAELGSNKRIRETEQQADRLAIWLMANAGFDVEAGPRMIERLRNRKGRPVFGYRTHNKWKKRLGFMNQEIAALNTIEPDAQGRRIPPLIKAIKVK